MEKVTNQKENAYFVVKEITIEKMDMVMEWICNKLYELNQTLDNNPDQSCIKILMPSYMERFIIEWRHRKDCYYLLEYDASFKYMGHVLSFDSPTHDVYVFHKDWCINPKQIMRHVLPITKY